MTTLADLTPDSRNARRHNVRNVAMIESSLQRDGFGRSILLANDGTIIAGNATIDAAASAGIEDVLVVESDGKRVIAVKRTDVASGSDAAINLALSDNRAAELAEWDSDVLAGLRDEVDLSALFSDDELAALLGVTKSEGHTDPDDVPAVPDEPITKPGDLWELGDHRILCGDARSPMDRQRVMDGRDSAALLFDPPWDADIETIPGDWSAVLAFGDGRRLGEIVSRFGAPSWVFVWDGVSSWYAPNRPLQRMKLCCWYGDIETYDFDGAHYGDPGHIHEVTNTRGTYHYVPDQRGKHLSDVFSLPLPRFHHESEHNHAKPVDWIRLLIGNCTKGMVFDPFAGSGTSIIACEQLDRLCVAIEIDPAIVDVIVRRWERFTGQIASLSKNEV